jgi:hypothetical protein
MINEGDPTPPCFDLPIDTCSTNQHNDACPSKTEIQRDQGDEKCRRFVDNFSAAKSNSYVHTWYVFYAADNTIKHISTLSMKYFPNTDYYTTDYCSTDYHPADYCSTNYCSCSIESSPADYQEVPEFRLNGRTVHCRIPLQTHFSQVMNHES